MTRMRFRGPRVIEGGRMGEATDARVAAVLDVLAGGRASVVAERHGVDPALLHRWTQAFTEAGTAAVTNRPGPDLARQRDRFLSVFTHGLRSPLAVAQAWVGLLGDMSIDAASRQQALVRLQAALENEHRDIALSPREKECLLWVAQGLRSKQIADKLGLRPVTVELHLKNARTKLRAATRGQAIAIALLNGLISP